MPRSFGTSDMVALPRLTAVTAARLARELLTAAAAEESELPEVIAKGRDEVAETRVLLVIELKKRIAAAGDDTSPGVRAADVVEDNALGALHDWLASFERLPADRNPESTDAAAVRQGMFPGGLGFLTLRPKDEWQEVETRIQLMKDKGWDKTIESLGGGAFLREIAFAHEAYGVAVGVTAVKQSPEPPALRTARDAAIEAIRGYVLQVSAQVRTTKPETIALAERLLRPLIEWRDKPARPTDDDEEEEVSDEGTKPTG